MPAKIALILLLCCSTFAFGAEGPPNVLWICGDDHAAYVYGAYGNRQVRTPNLDRLAAMGMRFDRAYCNSPVCTASRAAFLTGRYPRSVGVTLLKTALPEKAVTLAEMLKEAGYRTGAIGKMHFNNDLRHGFDVRLDSPDHARHLKDRGGRALPEELEAQPPWRPFRDHARIWLNSACLPVDAWDEDMESAYFARETANFLNQTRGEPFFLMVSFQEPHSPYRFPIEFASRHEPESFGAPAVSKSEEWQIPQIFRDLTPEEKRGIQAAYYTSVEYLDLNVGRVLEALERSGHGEGTIVIYTGDHGYMLGQHGRFEKHCSYEEAIRSPLVIKAPGFTTPNTHSIAMTELIDIVPTVLELCGRPIPESVQGRSLVPILQGRDASLRDAVTIEYAENEEAAIRTERYKLVYITGNRQRQDGYKTAIATGRRILLFDMLNDPSEIANLADQPECAEIVRGLLARLADHMARTDPEPEKVPKVSDPAAILDFCLRPRDELMAESRERRGN